MEKSLLIVILERGERMGIGKKYSISDILEAHFDFPVFIERKREDWLSEVATHLDILREMGIDNKYIKFSTDELSKINWEAGAGPITWFNDTEFIVWLTVKGLDYLNQYRFSQTALLLNQASLTNYRVQKTLSWVTLVIVAIGSFFSGLNFFRTDAKMDELSKNIQSLKEEVKISPSHKNTVPSHKASLPDSSHKH
mgnify:CR=1 FL=1